jgi:MFS family permease
MPVEQVSYQYSLSVIYIILNVDYMIGVGGLLATTIGGIFVAHNTGGKGGWRWVFYFQAILL